MDERIDIVNKDGSATGQSELKSVHSLIPKDLQPNLFHDLSEFVQFAFQLNQHHNYTLDKAVNL